VPLDSGGKPSLDSAVSAEENNNMRAIRRLPLAFLGALAVLIVVAPRAGRADVTIQQQARFEFAIIKAHATTIELTTTDKQRSDSDFRCEGLLSIVCGNAQSGDIIRLDRDLEWSLEPKNMEYEETPLPTAAQRLAARQEAQAMMEKIKRCPAVAQHSAPAPDISQCEMSAPRFEVKQIGTHAMLAGHDTQLAQIAMTRSCTNTTTGDVCDFLFALDSWLTQDQITGLADQKSFQDAYRAKLGIEARDPVMQKQLRQFLAPYADGLKQVSAKSGELKGYPLKTVLRVAFGGEHCATVKSQPTAGAGPGDGSQAATDAAINSAASNAAANASKNALGSSALSSAASALSSKLAGGLFKKKADAAAPAAESALPPGMIQAAQISIETISISAAAVPAEKFEIPVGWKRVEPQAKDTGSKEFSCPTTGS
jgi:hypothetical protein